MSRLGGLFPTHNRARSNSFFIIPNPKYTEIFHLPLQDADVEVAVAGEATTTTYLFSPYPISLPLISWLPGILNMDALTTHHSGSSFGESPRSIGFVRRGKDHDQHVS